MGQFRRSKGFRQVQAIKFLLHLMLLIPLSTSAGVLDRYKDNSSLVMNNRHCNFGNGKEIEIINGAVIVNGAIVVAYVSKIDKNRVSFAFVEDGNPVILNLTKKGKFIEATVPNGRILLNCSF